MDLNVFLFIVGYRRWEKDSEIQVFKCAVRIKSSPMLFNFDLLVVFRHNDFLEEINHLLVYITRQSAKMWFRWIDIIGKLDVS